MRENFQNVSCGRKLFDIPDQLLPSKRFGNWKYWGKFLHANLFFPSLEYKYPFSVNSPSSYLSSLQSLLKHNLHIINVTHFKWFLNTYSLEITALVQTEIFVSLESSHVPLFSQSALADPAAPQLLRLWKNFTWDKGFCKFTIKSWSCTDVRAPSKRLWENSRKIREIESVLSKVITADKFYSVVVVVGLTWLILTEREDCWLHSH